MGNIPYREIIALAVSIGFLVAAEYIRFVEGKNLSPNEQVVYNFMRSRHERTDGE